MPYTEHFVLEGIRFAAFAFVCGWGITGIWMAFPFGLTSAGIMYYLRFRYKTKKGV